MYVSKSNETIKRKFYYELSIIFAPVVRNCITAGVATYVHKIFFIFMFYNSRSEKTNDIHGF